MPDAAAPSLESRADLTLAAAIQVLRPMLPLLLSEGVTFQRLIIALKQALLEEAPAVLLDSGIPVNDSSVSTLTGIHRKDVREWRSAGRPRPQARIFSAVMNAFARWSSDPVYCDAKGLPRVLERKGGPGSFEARRPRYRMTCAPGRCCRSCCAWASQNWWPRTATTPKTASGSG